MKHYEIEINKFIDGELVSGKQKEMFAHISECSECRVLLNDYMKIKNRTKNFYNELESNFIPSGVFNTPQKTKNYKYRFYFSFAAAILLTFLYLTQFKNTLNSDEKFSELNNKFILLKEDYNNIFSKYQNKIITNENAKVENVKPEMISKGKSNNSQRKTFKKNIYAELRRSDNKSSYLEYINSLPTKKITSNDFLTEQIAGN